MTESKLLCLSIVSHGQGDFVASLLADLKRLLLADDERIEIVVTLNIPEDEGYIQSFIEQRLRVIRNPEPLGFGENHNNAFEGSNAKFFAVVNPDIRIRSLDIEKLLLPFENQKVVAVAPLVLSSDGEKEDSARKFPTLLRLAKRVLLKRREPDYEYGHIPFRVDWVAGMFVVYRSEAYKRVGGFDDRRFFMYLEDADICRRLHITGGEVLLNPQTNVVHMAQRASRRNLKHMRWHIISAMRYLSGL